MDPQIEEFDRRAAARRADLRELCAEFQSAISALASDDLQALKVSIEKQELLAQRLQKLLQENGAPLSSTSLPKEALDLIHITRVYSALLQRAMRTVSLRAELCRTYKLHLAKPGDPGTPTSWSCEA